MFLRVIEDGPVDTKGYLLGDEQSGEGIVIDVPIGGAAPLLAEIRGHELSVKCIVLTHGHFDHVGDVRKLAEALDAEVVMGAGDAAMLENPSAHMLGMPFHVEGMTPHRLLDEGDVVTAGRLSLRVLHVPGHTPGHIALYEMRHNLLFSGDALFHSSVGRTDLPGGDYDMLMQSITGKLLRLPEETLVYPGHGPHTSIGFEKGHNPFVLEYLDHF
ncbi:MAG: MBL fold metallo-hydrolase [Bacteroidota bacterium]|nr:MBL fold metallo-hydrolase [Bacteroidota bacterium]